MHPRRPVGAPPAAAGPAGPPNASHPALRSGLPTRDGTSNSGRDQGIEARPDHEKHEITRKGRGERYLAATSPVFSAFSCDFLFLVVPPSGTRSSHCAAPGVTAAARAGRGWDGG